MGLKRKRSRLIRIGSENYRWTISHSTQAESGCISVIIEAAEQPGQRIVVRTVCRNFWLDFSDFSDNPPAPSLDAYRPATPAMVRKMIRAALRAGWLPKRRQKNLTYTWSADGKLTAIAPYDE
jgi:hypothetical protein